MKEQTQSAIKLLEALTERAKELTCLYAIEEALREPDAEIDQVFNRIIDAIPPGWQFPEICVAKITLEGAEYRSQTFEETPWQLSADIVQQDQTAGTITVGYTKEMPAADVGPFLKEEKKLVETIADRINNFLTYKKMKRVLEEWQLAERDRSGEGRNDWEAVLDLIRQTDNALFLRLANKMLNHLCWSGIEEAEILRRENESQIISGVDISGDDVKGRRLSRLLDFSTEFTERIFRVAASHLSNDEILSRIQMWIDEDKLAALLRTVRRRLPLYEVTNSLRRYFFASREESDVGYPLARGLRVLLLECILSNRVDYINVAKDYVEIADLYHLLQNVIFSTESHGKLGGKSAGLFLASQILKKANGGSTPELPFDIPKTWFISSDMMLEFIHYNNMDEIIEQKYKDVERVRLEYPHVIEMFRQTVCPPEMANALSMALDDFGDSPLVVRSSSLLEDRMGPGFCGKYKSVFVGNQGNREERLRDLMRAVAEVYASNFGPDPIAYRMERGLLEFSEQMGVMIQEVVGTRVGRFFLTSYSGMARSHNDLPFLPGLMGKDSLIRMIPGLGTRATDRSTEEYPILLAPGRSSEALTEENGYSIRHAPKRLDVIDLESNRLQTTEIGELMTKVGAEYPGAEKILSVHKDGHLRPLDEDVSALNDGDLVVTFDGLVNRSPFMMHVRNLLKLLEEKLGAPVEIEFACDGNKLYLLQCCPRRFAPGPRPAPIPKDVTAEKLLFSANRYISNGCISNLTHIIYITPKACDARTPPADRQAVASAVAKLNELLPKRQYILMRPDGSETDSGRQSGVDINFVEFKNAGMLVDLLTSERSQNNFLPLRIHLLQDLVDSGIGYLPVYPDDEDTFFNERFLLRSQNILSALIPEYSHLVDLIKVIDVPKVAKDSVIQVRMNAELGEAVALLAEPDKAGEIAEEEDEFEDESPEKYWRWRHRMAEQIASQLGPEEYAVEGAYLFGSVKNGTAGPGSDIDMLIHFSGTDSQRKCLVHWLSGWSICLDEINYLRTGYRSGGLLDFHIVTDKDIANKTSYASKIDAITDAARPLKIRTADGGKPRDPEEVVRQSGKGAKR
jgi:hypothetical protein